MDGPTALPSTIQSTACLPRSPAPASSFLWWLMIRTRGMVVRRARGLNPYRKPRHFTSHDLGATDDGDPSPAWRIQSPLRCPPTSTTTRRGRESNRSDFEASLRRRPLLAFRESAMDAVVGPARLARRAWLLSCRMAPAPAPAQRPQNSDCPERRGEPDMSGPRSIGQHALLLASPRVVGNEEESSDKSDDARRLRLRLLRSDHT